MFGVSHRIHSLGLGPCLRLWLYALVLLSGSCRGFCLGLCLGMGGRRV